MGQACAGEKSAAKDEVAEEQQFDSPMTKPSSGRRKSRRRSTKNLTSLGRDKESGSDQSNHLVNGGSRRRKKSRQLSKITVNNNHSGSIEAPRSEQSVNLPSSDPSVNLPSSPNSDEVNANSNSRMCSIDLLSVPKSKNGGGGSSGMSTPGGSQNGSFSHDSDMDFGTRVPLIECSGGSSSYSNPLRKPSSIGSAQRTPTTSQAEENPNASSFIVSDIEDGSMERRKTLPLSPQNSLAAPPIRNQRRVSARMHELPGANGEIPMPPKQDVSQHLTDDFSNPRLRSVVPPLCNTSEPSSRNNSNGSFKPAFGPPGEARKRSNEVASLNASGALYSDDKVGGTKAVNLLTIRKSNPSITSLEGSGNQQQQSNSKVASRSASSLDLNTNEVDFNDSMRKPSPTNRRPPNSLTFKKDGDSSGGDCEVRSDSGSVSGFGFVNPDAPLGGNVAFQPAPMGGGDSSTRSNPTSTHTHVQLATSLNSASGIGAINRKKNVHNTNEAELFSQLRWNGVLTDVAQGRCRMGTFTQTSKSCFSRVFMMWIHTNKVILHASYCRGLHEKVQPAKAFSTHGYLTMNAVDASALALANAELISSTITTEFLQPSGNKALAAVLLDTPGTPPEVSVTHPGPEAMAGQSSVGLGSLNTFDTPVRDVLGAKPEASARNSTCSLLTDGGPSMNSDAPSFAETQPPEPTRSPSVVIGEAEDVFTSACHRLKLYLPPKQTAGKPIATTMYSYQRRWATQISRKSGAAGSPTCLLEVLPDLYVGSSVAISTVRELQAAHISAIVCDFPLLESLKQLCDRCEELNQSEHGTNKAPLVLKNFQALPSMSLKMPMTNAKLVVGSPNSPGSGLLAAFDILDVTATRHENVPVYRTVTVLGLPPLLDISTIDQGNWIPDEPSEKLSLHLPAVLAFVQHFHIFNAKSGSSRVAIHVGAGDGIGGPSSSNPNKTSHQGFAFLVSYISHMLCLQLIYTLDHKDLGGGKDTAPTFVGYLEWEPAVNTHLHIDNNAGWTNDNAPRPKCKLGSSYVGPTSDGAVILDAKGGYHSVQSTSIVMYRAALSSYTQRFQQQPECELLLAGSKQNAAFLSKMNVVPFVIKILQDLCPSLRINEVQSYALLKMHAPWMIVKAFDGDFNAHLDAGYGGTSDGDDDDEFLDDF